MELPTSPPNWSKASWAWPVLGCAALTLPVPPRESNCRLIGCILGDGSCWSWRGIPGNSGVGTRNHSEQECLPSCPPQALHPWLPLIKHNQGFISQNARHNYFISTSLQNWSQYWSLTDHFSITNTQIVLRSLRGAYHQKLRLRWRPFPATQALPRKSTLSINPEFKHKKSPKIKPEFHVQTVPA